MICFWTDAIDATPLLNSDGSRNGAQVRLAVRGWGSLLRPGLWAMATEGHDFCGEHGGHWGALGRAQGEGEHGGA